MTMYKRYALTNHLLICSITQRVNPSPLELCFHPMYFDLQNDTSKCPIERNALKDFYDSSKGGEWTDSTNWTNSYMSHCNWHGIKCNEGTTINIMLPNNGLTGTLSKSIANLSSLKVLDLSDNDIKVSHAHLFFCLMQYHPP